ncbi:MAG: FAD-dependent oxidoreductase [Rhodospirillales bacterium]|nr:FAD-dependent oxidoreductase [Rhodospirillales bacterium]
MTGTDADLCIIGAGSGGLSVAAGAAQLGARTILIERHRMGGDCLNFGCVPSKSLLAAAEVAASARGAARFGVDTGIVSVDGRRVRDHVREVIAAIAPHDSAERFESLGCRVIRGSARFTASDAIAVGDMPLRARRFVIATGSVPRIPPLPGVERTPFLTNETIFDLDAVPRHLLIIGGGPIGVEMAQAWRRLGADVTVFQAGALLPRDDADLTDVVRQRLRGEGVALHEAIRIIRVDPAAEGVAVTWRGGDDAAGEVTTHGSHLLIATGRRASVEDLDLPRAGIAASAQGITVDRRLRTSNHNVFAIGDVVGTVAGLGASPRFTHVAGYHAGIVVKNALFRWPAKVDHRAVPHVTYTDPELAQVGLTEAAAVAAGHTVRILQWPFVRNDRALAEGDTQGLAKIVTSRRGRVLGAGIVGRAAGELIQPWVLALHRGLPIRALATMIVPYPTRSEVTSRAAGSFYTESLFSARTRWLVRQLARLG